MRFNKKASLEMSIQAIVIVVLAMTLLGLGLGFIKGMFRNITSTTEDVSEQVRQKVLDDLIQGDKKISFPKSEIIVNKGESTVLTVGIRNKNNDDLKYKIRFAPISGPAGALDATGAGTRWFQYDESQYTLKSAESEVRNIRIDIPTTVTSGSYFFSFDVLLPEPSGGGSFALPASLLPVTTNNVYYAQKDIFIVIRG